MRDRCVIIESPYAGKIEENLEYLSKCLRHSLLMGEAPFASHAIYPMALDDNLEGERALGLAMADEWRSASRTVFYLDKGISQGMRRAAEYLNVHGGRHTCRFLFEPRPELVKEIDDIISKDRRPWRFDREDL